MFGSSTFQIVKKPDVAVVGILIAIVAILVGAKSAHYLLFHTMAEIFAIVVSLSIFMLTWISNRYLANGYLIVLGAAYGAIGFVDIFHTLTFKGMNLFPGVSTNYPTQFWLTARYLEAAALLCAPLFISKKPNFFLISAGFAAIAAGACFAVVYKWFPDTFVDGVGLTPFKVYSEYVIIAMLLVGFVLLYRLKHHFEQKIFFLLVGSMWLAVATEFCFTRYAGFFDFTNELGHYFRFLSVALAFVAIVLSGVRQPLELIFRELGEHQHKLGVVNESLTRSETNLKNQNNLLSTLLKNLTIGVFMVEAPSGRPLVVNDMATRLLGRGIQPDATKQNLAEFFHAYKAGSCDTYPLEEMPIVLGMRGVSSHVDDLVVEKPDGTKSLLEIFGSPVRDDQGRVWASLVSFADITERKRAEDALQLSASVFAHAREGITVTDLKGNIVDINLAFSRITGYDRVDVLGKNPRILQSGKQDKAFYIAMWRDLISQGYWEGEIWNRHKNGDVYPERLAIAAVRDAHGNTQQYVAMFSNISERKRIELELMESEQKFRLIAENTSDGITIFGKNRKIQYVSPSVVKQLGYSESEELGRSNADVYALLDPEGRDALFNTINKAIENRSPSLTYSYRIKHKAGHYIWREDSTNFRYTNDGAYDGAYVVSRDITERKQFELEVLRSNNRYQGILNNMMDAYWRVDMNGRIVEANQAICQMLGYTKEELLVMSISDFDVIESEEDTRKHIKAIQRDRHDLFESQHRCRDGRIVDVEISASLAFDAPGNIDAFHRNITERKRMENQIREMAFHDSLTKLPNRRLLNDRLTQAMAANKRSGSYGALMFLDLDNFKPLNDAHGHEVGDLLLIEAACRLKGCVREMDTVARFGGDEFVVMISELVVDKVGSTKQARNVADKIRIALSEPYRLPIKCDGKAETAITHHCTASIGVALFSNHEASPDVVLKWADAMMYQAKNSGRDAFRIYGEELPETTAKSASAVVDCVAGRSRDEVWFVRAICG
jgi:diguanylate cyclase (GGDEF)-like protein/PAS domain S-box-containing protein